MEHLYSIMPLDTEHLEEICLDIKEQYEKGISTCALFMFKLLPEGNPLIDKAKIQGEKYKLFQNRLEEMGLHCGILVQCTIGHGYKFGEENTLTKYVNVTDGKVDNIVCPYDVTFQEYIRGQMQTVATYAPKVIMVDDDFRLMYRAGRGCACSLHMKAYNQKAKSNLRREELYGLLQADGNNEYKKNFVETQRESLLQSAKAMREGIDLVDPTLPGVFCCVGPTTEFAPEIAKILAGKNNPSVVRLHNGNYTAAGARWFSDVSYRAAENIYRLKQGNVDVILAETDTCPQNRYSTGATSLHAHFTASILEGTKGAKHWITRLKTHEPNSGNAYRKILSEYKNFYMTLSDIVPSLQWQGCRMPFAQSNTWSFKKDEDRWKKNWWLRCVLERFGFPSYCSPDFGGVAFLEGDYDQCFRDEEILELLKGVLVLDVFALERLNDRGFLKYTGVITRKWNGETLSYEKLKNGCICNVQVASKELVPLVKEVEVDSVVCHLERDEFEKTLFPAVTIYHNGIGGTVIATCGTPHTEYNYMQAFSFLNESRKKQFADIFSRTGELPIYYAGDAEIYMKTAIKADGRRLCAIFNIGLDVLEELPFTTNEKIKNIQILQKDGIFCDCGFERTVDGVIVKTTAYTLLPIILLIDCDNIGKD